MKRNVVLPPNFDSTHIVNIVDAQAQDSLLPTIELIINVMLDHEKSDQYIQKIMSLSSSALEDI